MGKKGARDHHRRNVHPIFLPVLSLTFSLKHINLRKKLKQRWCNNFFYDFLFCCVLHLLIFNRTICAPAYVCMCVCVRKVSMTTIRGRLLQFRVCAVVVVRSRGCRIGHRWCVCVYVWRSEFMIRN